MQLIERWPRDLPMRLFVEVAQRYRIGQQQVELLRHLQANWFFQFDRQRVRHCTVSLNLRGALVDARLRIRYGLMGGRNLFRHTEDLLIPTLYSRWFAQ